jgi:hypothetical protein
MGDSSDLSSGNLRSTLSHADPHLQPPTLKPGEGVSKTKHKFFHWLSAHGGSGVLTKRKISLLAGGDVLSLGISPPAVQIFLKACVDTGFLVQENEIRYTLSSEGAAYLIAHPTDKRFEGVSHGKVERAPLLDEAPGN